MYKIFLLTKEYILSKKYGLIFGLRHILGVGGVNISRKKRYEGVMFNVIALRGGGWRSNIHKKALRNT